MSIYTDDSPKTLRFSIDAVDITSSVVLNSFSLEDIMSTGQLNFGECNTARAELITSENLMATGKKILVEYGYENTWEKVGTYKVTYSATQENSSMMKLTMYDCVNEADMDVSEWYNGIVWPVRLKDMRDSLCAYLGIVQTTKTLVNDNIILRETVLPSNLNGKEVLRCIGQINGVFPHANESYELDWVSLGAHGKTIAKSLLVEENAYTKKSYQTSPITKLILRGEDGDVGTIVGTGTNAYVVSANMLIYGMTEEELQGVAGPLFNKIQGISYTPCEIVIKYIPDIKMGDCLIYEGNVFYVLDRALDEIMNDDILSDGNQYLEEDTSTKTKIEQLRGKTNVLYRDVETTKQTIVDVESDLKSEITQTADNLTVLIQQLQDSIDGSIEVFYTQEAPTLINYPAWDWGDGPICDGTFECSADNPVTFTYSDGSFSEHIRSVVYDQTNSVTYRFIKTSGLYIWEVLENTDFSVVLGKIANLEISVDGVNSSVQRISLDLDENYYVKSETNSLIQQTSNNILLQVSGSYATKDVTNDLSASIELKLNREDMVSELNASADVIVLTGSRFSWSSAYSSMTKDGKLKATSGEFTGKVIATSGEFTGKVKASSGDIAGWDITTNYIGTTYTSGGNTYLCRMYSSPVSVSDRKWFIFLRKNNASVTAGIDVDGMFYTTGNLFIGGWGQIYGDMEIAGDLDVYGSKNRVVNTSRGSVRLSAYETATPYFGDIGSGVIDADGTCVIMIEDLFWETIEDDYKVFVQGTSAGTLWVEKCHDYFVVHGEAGCTFDYEVKGPQEKYGNVRLEKVEEKI